MQLEDELLRHRVAIVVEVDADENYLWIWAKTRLADLVADLRRRGVSATAVRIHVDGFLNP
jgi:hypothetical protein